MSERREFVKVERTDGKARYSVTVPIEVDPLHARTDALERRIDRIDGMLDGMGRGAESRFEAIECRIAAMERKLSHKTRGDA